MASASSLFEIAINSVQMFASMIEGKIEFDSDTVRPIANAFNLGAEFFQKIAPELDDFRLQFIAISLVLPIIFIYMGLLFVNPLRVILWYFMIMFGVLTIFVGAAGAIINQIASSSQVRFQLSRNAANILIIMGCIALFLCVALYAARNHLLTCCNAKAWKEVSNKHLSLEERMATEIEEVDWNATISRLITIVLFILIGASFVGAVNLGGPVLPIASLARGLGWTCISIAIATTPYFILGLFHTGREWQWKIAHFMEQNFLRFYLLLLSIIYIPVGASLFLVFNCNDFACPSGYRLFDEGSLAPFNKTNVTDVCVPCDLSFPNRYCPASVRTTMCAAPPDSRLEADLAIKCANVRPFFWPAAFLVMVCFMFGVPYLFYKLIRDSTEKLAEKFPDVMNDDGSFTVSSYEESVMMTNNVARFLYQPFKSDLKYTRLVLILQKLLIVFTAQFVIRVPGTDPTAISVFCSVVIHALVTAALAWWRPFLHAFENWVAFLMQIALVITSILTILIYYRINMPSGLFVAVVVLNFLLPVIALIIGIILEWRGRREQAEVDKAEAMQEVENQLQSEQAAKDADLQRKIVQYQLELAEYHRAVAALDAEKQTAFDAVAVARANGDISYEQEATMIASVQQQFAQMYPTPPVEPTSAAEAASPSSTVGGGMSPAEQQLCASPKPAPDDLSDADEHLADDGEGKGLNPLSDMAAHSRNLEQEERRQQEMEQDDVDEEAEDKLFADETPDEKKRRRAARLRRRRQELHRKVMRKKEVQMELVEKRRATVDMEIDDDIKAALNQSIMISGIMFILAMCFCLVGLLSPDSVAVTAYSDNSLRNTAEYEFLQYGSWQNFTEACCCTAMTSLSGDLVVEKWTCLNGKVKERLRKTSVTLPSMVLGNVTTVVADGYAVRELCAPVFKSGCSIVMSTDGNGPRVELGVHCFKNVPNVTGLAQRDLW